MRWTISKDAQHYSPKCVRMYYAAFKLDQSASAVHLLRALYLSRLHDPTPHYARYMQTLQHRSPWRRVVLRGPPCSMISLLHLLLSSTVSLLHFVAGGPSRCDIEKILELYGKSLSLHKFFEIALITRRPAYTYHKKED